MVAQRPDFSLGNPVHRAGLSILLNEVVKKSLLFFSDLEASQVSKEALSWGLFLRTNWSLHGSLPSIKHCSSKNNEN